MKTGVAKQSVCWVLLVDFESFPLLVFGLAILNDFDGNHFANLPRDNARDLIGNIDPISLNAVSGDLFGFANPSHLFPSLWFSGPIKLSPRLWDIAIFRFID